MARRLSNSSNSGLACSRNTRALALNDSAVGSEELPQLISKNPAKKPEMTYAKIRMEWW